MLCCHIYLIASDRRVLGIELNYFIWLISNVFFPRTMPRSKEGKTREKIDPKALESAVNDVLKGTLKVNEAARRYGLSNSTVSRHYKSCLALQVGINEEQPRFPYDSEKNAVKKIFTNDEELMLVKYLEESAALHYGLTKKSTPKLALSQKPCQKSLTAKRKFLKNGLLLNVLGSSGCVALENVILA